MSDIARPYGPTVYQIEESGYGADIASSYAAAMRRLLHRVLSHPKYAAFQPKVTSNYANFSLLSLGGRYDTEMAAIRYAMSIVPGQFVVAEHEICDDPDRQSLSRRIDILSEFDPSFEVLLRLFCVKSGELSLRKACTEVADVIAAGVRGTIRLHGSVNAAYDHLQDARIRNGGIDFLIDGSINHNLVETFPGMVQDRFRRLAAEMDL